MATMYRQSPIEEMNSPAMRRARRAFPKTRRYAVIMTRMPADGRGGGDAPDEVRASPLACSSVAPLQLAFGVRLVVAHDVAPLEIRRTAGGRALVHHAA